MAYTNFTNCTASEYKEIIYSQDTNNKIKILFNNIELNDADEYCEKLTVTSRVLPSDGSKRFSLGNFISKEATLILRNLPNGTTIEDQVSISIGTLVDANNNTYEYVPIGIFNIQDTPTTDKNRTTIKLRDNRVKFDFNYNAKPLIDEEGGSATYMQILEDICDKAGVTSDIVSFEGDNISVAIYDNSITGSTYIGYLAEQAGAIPVITREGHLNFIYLDSLTTWQIPLSIVEKYELGTPFEIQRVVYESGIIKYETSSDETLETLYLDAANMYITSQDQVDAVFSTTENFTIDSVKTGKILGNPAIDAWDLIEIYDDEDANETTIFTTLANNTYTYSGVNTNTFETQIGLEARTENVTIKGDTVFKKTIKAEINNLDASLTIVASDTEDVKAIVVGIYGLTEDTTYQADKNYYISTGVDTYELFTDYTVGSSIPADTIYELTGSKIDELSENNSKLQNQINTANRDIETLQGSTVTTSTFKTTVSGITGSISKVTKLVGDNKDETDAAIANIRSYVNYKMDVDNVGMIVLGMESDDIELRLKNNILYFWSKTKNDYVAYLSKDKLYILDAKIIDSLQLGNFAFIPRKDNYGNDTSLGFRKVS